MGPAKPHAPPLMLSVIRRSRPQDTIFVAQRRNEIAMSQLFRFPSSVKREPAIDTWMREHSGELGAIAQRWFQVMRDCGDDVRELLHDGHATACVGDAAFAYVNAFKAHVNVGFFRGAEIADPEGMLEGTAANALSVGWTARSRRLSG